jgi:hypothetical protein
LVLSLGSALISGEGGAADFEAFSAFVFFMGEPSAQKLPHLCFKSFLDLSLKGR